MKKHLTITEASKILGISRACVRNAIIKRELDAVQFNKKERFYLKAESIEEYKQKLSVVENAITTKEYSDQVGVTLQTVRNWIKSKKVNSMFHRGRYWIIL